MFGNHLIGQTLIQDLLFTVRVSYFDLIAIAIKSIILIRTWVCIFIINFSSCEYVRTKEWSNIHSGQNVFDYSSTAVVRNYSTGGGGRGGEEATGIIN